MSQGRLAAELQSAPAAPARRRRSSAPRAPRLHPAAQGHADAACGSLGGRTAGPGLRELRACEASSRRAGQPRSLPSSLEGAGSAFPAAGGDLLGPELSSPEATRGAASQTLPLAGDS